eukprot:7950004-Pyramimonas_sp.AAC.1
MFAASVTELSDKVWGYIQHHSTEYQFRGLLEAHVHEKGESHTYDERARKLKLRLRHNSARPSGEIVATNRQHRSNGGGE